MRVVVQDGYIRITSPDPAPMFCLMVILKAEGIDFINSLGDRTDVIFVQMEHKEKLREVIFNWRASVPLLFADETEDLLWEI